MSTFIQTILTLTEAYCEAKNLSESHISKTIFNDGKTIGLLRKGSDIGVKRYERAVQWFSDKWPEDKAWPTQYRPTPFHKAY